MTQPPQDSQQPQGQPVGDQAQYGQPSPEPQFNQQQPYGTPYQGQPQFAAGGEVGQKSKLVAGILGILLGGLGIHNFYLGFTKKGVIQLLITVLSIGFLSWISAIWGLVEGVLILVSKSGEQWHRDADGLELTD